MAFQRSLLMNVFLILFVPSLCLAQTFDFFYLVLEWPGSRCDTSSGCCFPTTGRPPADFNIQGFWPSFSDGSSPSDCDANNPYDESLVSDLISRMQEEWPSLNCPSESGSSFWSLEWGKHGTCSESVLSQHDYFATALSIKGQLNILGSLETSGVTPNGGSYALSTITSGLQNEIGATPGIECNIDASGNNQLYRVHVCVNNLGSNVIECPFTPSFNCDSSITFPPF